MTNKDPLPPQRRGSVPSSLPRRSGRRISPPRDKLWAESVWAHPAKDRTWLGLALSIPSVLAFCARTVLVWGLRGSCREAIPAISGDQPSKEAASWQEDLSSCVRTDTWSMCLRFYSEALSWDKIRL